MLTGYCMNEIKKNCLKKISSYQVILDNTVLIVVRLG